MPSDHSGTGLLAIFAHPDDEFAVFPWLERALRSGSKVHAVWLTDGGWGGQDIQKRQRESVRVLRSFGLLEENMHFLGARLSIPDGGLHVSLPSASKALVELAQQVKPGELMAPAWEGGHQDHDAAHLAAQVVMRTTGVVGWEYSLYHGFGLKGPLFNVLSLVPRAGQIEVVRATLRQRMGYILRCFQYSSQWKSFLGLLPIYAWRLRSPGAFKRRSMHYEWTAKRPHEGSLLYERRTGFSWDEFASMTAEFRMPTTGD